MNLLSSKIPNSPFGFVVIDKPSGITSHDCVNQLRGLFKIRRIGHGGTLDPAVTGVLPMALGEATRLLPYLPGAKTYKGTIQLGLRTTTNDIHGEILSNQNWPQLKEKTLEEFLDKFRGDIEQTPPMISSVHVKGERAYKKARRNEIFELMPRAISVYKLVFLNWDQTTGKLELSIHCSSGTYIRAIARDLGEVIGCGACLASLRRTQALGFEERQASLLPIETSKISTNFPRIINPIQALAHLPRLQLTSNEETMHWRTGRKLIIDNARYQEAPKPSKTIEENYQDACLVLDLDSAIAGIALHSKDGPLQPKVVFNALG